MSILPISTKVSFLEDFNFDITIIQLGQDRLAQQKRVRFDSNAVTNEYSTNYAALGVTKFLRGS